MIPRFHSRALPRSLRIEFTVAVAVSALALAAIATSARAQQAPGTLPPIVVAPPPAIKKAPAKKAAAVPAKKSPEPASQLGTYNPALDLPGLTLPPGTTLTTAGPVVGYRALSAMSTTKTATPIEQIPQSIQVIPQSVIRDQTPVSVTEVARNVSNVQSVSPFAVANTDLQPVKIRGFGAEQWLDGLPVIYNTGDRDTFANIERIEVLKGPNAILYGGGSGAPIGGALNIVSKLPTNVASTEVGVTVGSHNYFRPYFDINQPLNSMGTLLFRLTGEYKQADSQIDILHSQTYSLNPTLTLTNKTDTTLTLQARLSRQSQQGYQGLPVFGSILGDFRIDRNLFIGPSNMPPSYSEVQGITVTLDHKFNSILSSEIKARWSQSKFDSLSQNVYSFDPTGAQPLFGSTWALQNLELYQEQREFTINPSLKARFGLGESKNTVLIGGDYSLIKDKGFMTGDYLGNACALFLGLCPPNPAAFVDLTNPSFPIPYAKPSPAAGFDYASFFNFNNTYKTAGVYGQVQTTLYDRVHLLGALRYASLNVQYNENALTPPATFTTDTTKVLPRAGIVVDIVKGLSVYGSYSEGMRWAGFTTAVATPLPELSKQYEAGVKLNFNNSLSGTIAYFDIAKDNVPVTTALGQASLSNQTSNGIETDLLWQPSRTFQALVSYGYTNVRFGDDFRGFNGAVVPAGNRVPYVPDHSARVWANYKLDDWQLRGWSVGAGVYAAAGQYVDNENAYKTGGYYTLDTKVAYETDNFRASFNVKNLTGQQYWEPYVWLGGQVAPGLDRAYYATFAYKF